MPEIDPEALRTLAADWETMVGATVTRGSTALAGSAASEILSDNFTNVHWALAGVYVEAYHFMIRDLETKHGDAVEYRTRLENTADGWHDAEFHSTVKLPGR